jgi:hypothetical protein
MIVDADWWKTINENKSFSVNLLKNIHIAFLDKSNRLNWALDYKLWFNDVFIEPDISNAIHAFIFLVRGLPSNELFKNRLRK